MRWFYEPSVRTLRLNSMTETLRLSKRLLLLGLGAMSLGALGAVVFSQATTAWSASVFALFCVFVCLLLSMAVRLCAARYLACGMQQQID